MIDLPVTRIQKTEVQEKVIKVVYCLYRVSTMSQVEKNDIPMQRSACHEFAAKKKGWIIKREFMELGVSGFKLSVNERDQMQELKVCAEKKEFDVLLVFMFDRLGRRDDETPFVLRWFTEHGIEVWSVKEGQQTFQSSVDDLINYIRFWSAKVESHKTSIRVSTRLRQMVSEGKFTGGIAPFGYRLVLSGEINKYGRMMKKLEIDPCESEIVKLIFNKTVYDGYGSHVMANTINELGIRTHMGATFVSNTINRILRNTIYCGYYYRAGVLSPRQSELQIIDDDVYNEAQRLLNGRMIKQREKENIAKFNKSNALLSGNIFCGFCGQKLNVTSHAYSYYYQDGVKHWKTHPRYMCIGKSLHRSECQGQGAFTAHKVDALVVDYLRSCQRKLKYLMDNECLDTKYINTISELNERIKMLKREKETTERKLKTLYSEVADSIEGKSSYSPDTLSLTIMEERDNQNNIISEINRLQSQLMDNQHLKGSINRRYEEFKEMLHTFFDRRTELPEKRMIVNKIFDKITVSRGSGGQYHLSYRMREDYSDFIEE